MSRRTRWFISALCVIIAALWVSLDQSCFRQSKQSQNLSQEQSAVSDFEKYNDKTAIVINAIDGDTLDIAVPDGKYDHTRIRLWGVDTPETKNPNTGVMYFGPEASKFTKKSTLGKGVHVFLDAKHSRDKYGRILAYIQLPDGKFLNEELLSEGFAYADVRFKHNYYHKYMQLEAAARSGKKGLWQNVTREQLPAWLQREKPNLLKK